MKTTAAALCALLVATPVIAQQSPQVAPPSQDAGVGQGTADLSPQAHQALAAVSRNTVAAQQFGNLAATKQAPAAIRDLGDRMVALNSQINERLDNLAPQLGVQLPQTMPVQDQQFFEALAETNRDEFARGLVAWVNEVYPETIRALQAVADQPEMRGLAQAAIPQLRDQLEASQQLAQEAGQGGGQQTTERPQVNQETESQRRAEEGSGLLAAIANPDDELRQLRATSDLEPDQVRVVPAREAIPSGEVQAVRRSVQENRSGIDRLRRAIGQEDALTQALRGNNASPRDVIAMDVRDEGVVLYTLDTQQAETPAR